MRQRGFTYLGLLFAIVFIGLLLGAVGEVWQTTVKREREAELLFVGRQIAGAIATYRAATPGDAKQWPKRLEDLLEDGRNPAVQRHLRRIYIDPFTGKPEWGLIKSGEFIIGIHSQGEDKPLKQAGFLPEEESFAGATSYRDWRFLGQAGGRSGIQ
jgi:type II secretory pathway pseudopilin PulG